MSEAAAQAVPESKVKRDRPLVWHLAALAVGAAAPFIAIATYLAIQLVDSDIAETNSTMEELAQATSTSAERMMGRTREMLAEIAARPGVRALDPARCDPLLNDLHQLHPEYASVFTVAASGRRVCSTLYAVSANTPLVNSDNYLDEIKSTKSFTIGLPAEGRMAKKWIISAAQPILAADGTVAGALGVSIDLVDLASIVMDQGAPSEPVVAILNSKGVVIARHPFAAGWLGRDLSATSPIARLALQRKSGNAREKGVMGIERLWGFAPVRGTDWTVLCGKPVDAVMAPIYRTMTGIAVLATGGIGFVILLCVILARPIARPIKAISAAARRMSSQESIEYLEPSGPDEIAALAEDLNRMLDRRLSGEQKLRERDNELSLLTENYPGWLMHLDRDLRFRYVNSEYLVVTGHRLEEILGVHVRDIVGEARYQRLSPRLARALRGARQTFEDERETAAGATVSMLMSLVPDFGPGGEVQGLLVFGSDITELKRAEEAVRTLNMDLERRVAHRTAELEAVNRELESFDYSISHDLRAPINRICGFSEALLTGSAEIQPQTRDLLGRIQASATSMDLLVNDLLSLSTLSRTELHRVDVDLSTIARSVLNGLQGEPRQRSVKLIVASGVHAAADPGLIRIVLANLLGNAWKFTARREDAEIEFGVDLSCGAPRYFVRDNGAGFDMTHARRLFEPFRRLHSQTEFAGTGIGLATVARVVRRHGGRAWAEAAVGRGATIFFTLSAEMGDAAAQSATRPVSPQIA